MKNTLILLLASLSFIASKAQLKVKASCSTLIVDVLDGKVNSVHPDYTSSQVKSEFPCFTKEDPASSKCGDVIYYTDRDIKFFITRNYVEIGPNFKGKLSLPLLNGKRGSFFKWLGAPKMKDAGWDAFQTQYGCLILYYNAASKVQMIRFSTKTTDEINLCE